MNKHFKAFFFDSSVLCAAVDWSTVPTTVSESNNTDMSKVYTNMNTLVVADSAQSPAEELQSSTQNFKL